MTQDSRMAKGEYILKLCTLSHPDELAVNMIRRLLQKNSNKSTFNNFDSLGVSIATVKIPIESTYVKIVFLRTDEKEFFSKLRSYYRGVSGAIILFTRNNKLSFEKAKMFYQFLKKVIEDLIVPTVFIDVLDKAEKIDIEEPEELDDIKEKVVYFEIIKDDSEAFSRILEYLSKRYLENILK